MAQGEEEKRAFARHVCLENALLTAELRETYASEWRRGRVVALLECCACTLADAPVKCDESDVVIREYNISLVYRKKKNFVRFCSFVELLKLNFCEYNIVIVMLDRYVRNKKICPTIGKFFGIIKTSNL